MPKFLSYTGKYVLPAMLSVTQPKITAFLFLSMKCSLMVSVAAFGLGDPGSNPGWFTVLN